MESYRSQLFSDYHNKGGALNFEGVFVITNMVIIYSTHKFFSKISDNRPQVSYMVRKLWIFTFRIFLSFYKFQRFSGRFVEKTSVGLNYI